MKKYIKQIIKTRDEINNEITERDAIFNDRSVTYQSSRHGEAYTEQTVNLVAMRDILNGFIEDFNHIENALI